MTEIYMVLHVVCIFQVFKKGVVAGNVSYNPLSLLGIVYRQFVNMVGLYNFNLTHYIYR